MPIVLLNQQEKTNLMFNIVLGLLGSISLLVGGIGIMNIMYLSVTERRYEIGILMAVGAPKDLILGQFLTESSIIGLLGGLTGIVAGLLLTYAISAFFHIETYITGQSVAVAFLVAFSISLFFGYFPARKASLKSPSENLRM
ncbi:MAG: FtsX-like permease family protein [Bacteroidales bacterium]|nr:FtsX-like permease family protein [Bacteroidales bacterium]